MGRTCTLSVDGNGVATVTLENPPVNALHPDVLRALSQCLQEAHGRDDVRGIVIVGSGKNFCAGFDIGEFAKGTGDVGDSIKGASNILTEVLEEGAKPTVAAVRGIALGGGCEVAIACNARVLSPDARIGLPELQLGIIPGFGGTQRLPRLVGLQAGLEMILTSKPVNAKKAHALGIADAVCERPEDLLAEAKRLALDLASGKVQRVRTLERTDRLEPAEVAQMVFAVAREQTRKRAPHLQHPLLCIDAIEAGVVRGGKAGLAAETQAFADAAKLPAHKALVHVFFAMRGTKKVRGVTDVAGAAGSPPPRKLATVAVLGGGLMGSGIATASLLNGMRVVLKDVSAKFLDAGLARIRKNLESRQKKGKLTEAKVRELTAPPTLVGVIDYDPSVFGRADIVIEAALENVQLKQDIFRDLEKVCRPDCILSSNTSTIDITLIGAKMQRPERIVGAHFFSPAHVMPLLEIVRSHQTPPDIVRDTLAYASVIKKTPVVVGNCTGFAVNRVFFPYTMSAMLLCDAGVDPYVIDQAVQRGFGMPIGPFRLSDLVGADIGLHVGANFVQAFPSRVYTNLRGLIVQLNETKCFGEKSGKGFYQFKQVEGNKKRTKAVKDLASLQPLLDCSRAAAQSELGVPALASAASIPPELIVEMIFYPVVNEACRVLAEGVVDKAADLDIATVMSMGFPPYRGGIVHWGDHVGAMRIATRLQHFASMFPNQSGFFVPCEYLLQCAHAGVKLADGQKFYQPIDAKL